MALRPYPSQLEDALTLRDGSTVRVRPIKAKDEALERRFIDGLSAQSRYQRFLHQVKELPPQLLARFTNPDYDREMALVALAPGSGEFIGVARYAPNAGGHSAGSALADGAGFALANSAEFALTVADAWQGRGLGHALLEKLCDCARAAGYAALDGIVLNDNSEMLELVAQLGFVRTGRDGDTVAVTRRLQDPAG